MSFNPKKHLTKVKGKDYLEVKWRLVWFRDDHPDWSIKTDFVQLNMDQGIAVAKASIINENGQIVSEGTKTEYKASFFDFVEKAETGAVGRALAHLGYGTQFAPELEVEELGESDRLADSPVEQPNKGNSKGSNEQTSKNDTQGDRQGLINKLTARMKEVDLENGEAKKKLQSVVGKNSLGDCDVQELKQFYLAIANQNKCFECGEQVEDKVKKYCLDNQEKFDHQILCFKHQKPYK